MDLSATLEKDDKPFSPVLENRHRSPWLDFTAFARQLKKVVQSYLATASFDHMYSAMGPLE
jgi:hypothetical protein